MTHDAPFPAAERAPLVNPRALTTLATAVGLVYTLHQPVRWILRVAADVDLLAARVSALEGELARRSDSAGDAAPGDRVRLTPRLSPSTCPSRSSACP